MVIQSIMLDSHSIHTAITTQGNQGSRSYPTYTRTQRGFSLQGTPSMMYFTENVTIVST